MKVLILAAGYGTRLYPLTEKQAKPLLPVAGKPMVEHIINKVEEIDEVDEICMVVNQKFAGNFERWVSGFKTNKKVSLFNDGSTDDADKLGAIGDMKFVIEKGGISDDLLVVAGDNLFDFSFSPFVNFFKERGTSIGLYRVEPIEDVKKYSVVELDESERVLNFEEKPEHPSTNLIAICMYLFPKDKLSLISDYLQQGNNPDAPGYYIKWLVKKARVYGFVFSGMWFDIGDLKSYNEADKALRGGEK
jgi:glucose-1-phosphate thymidylyltransferase